jgi:hypothetical protein
MTAHTFHSRPSVSNPPSQEEFDAMNDERFNAWWDAAEAEATTEAEAADFAGQRVEAWTFRMAEDR